MNINVIAQRTAVCSALFLLTCTAAAAQPGRGGPPPPDEPPPAVPMQTDALKAIERAYDSVNRAAAFPANTAGANAVAVTSIVTQGQAAYQEALSRYQASDLVGARELAMAATDLSRAVEELAASILPASTQLTPPPQSLGVNEAAFRANDELARAGRAILEAEGAQTTYGGTIAADTANQTKTLLSTSRQLQQRGQTLLVQNQPRQASSQARAADALAHAATHLQNRYLIAAGVVPAAPPPLPGPPPPGGRGRGRGPGG